MNFNTDDERKELTSDFNEAKNQIDRLDGLWRDCNRLSCSGNLVQWKWKLDTVWRELSSDAKQKDKLNEKNNFFEQLKELNQKIADQKSNPGLLYDALQAKEIFLRGLQDEVGKGGKRSSDDEDDLDD